MRARKLVHSGRRERAFNGLGVDEFGSEPGEGRDRLTRLALSSPAVLWTGDRGYWRAQATSQQLGMGLFSVSASSAITVGACANMV